MSRICALLCMCMLILAGCMHTTQAQFTRHYALGGSPPAVGGRQPATRADQKILQVARISVPPWLAGSAMYYRLDYRDDGRLAAYGHSDWVAPPATLLEPIVQNAIAAGGGWRAVVGPRNPAMADASLHLQLGDFSQVFAQPDQSTGVIDATATLIDDHDDRVIAQKHFRIEIAAATPDAPGGARALAEASGQIAAQLQRWLETAAGKASTPAEPETTKPSR